MSAQYTLAMRGGWTLVGFKEDCQAAEVKSILAENTLVIGDANDILLFRDGEKDWQKFLPLKAMAGGRVTVTIPIAGDPLSILTRSAEMIGGKGTWVICKAESPKGG